MKKIISAILILSVLFINTSISPPKKETIKEIPMRKIGGLYFIELRLNGKRTLFLLDSGAVVSLLDINQNRKYNFVYDDSSMELIGLGGTRSKYHIYNYQVKHDDSNLDLKLYGVDLRPLTYQKPLTGIIGSDFLSNNSAIINYRDNTLILRK